MSLYHLLPPLSLLSLLLIYSILQTLLSKATSQRITFTHRLESRKATASSPGAARMRCLAQGHLDTQLEGAGDRSTSIQYYDDVAFRKLEFQNYFDNV